jgi:hypothetical protein
MVHSPLNMPLAQNTTFEQYNTAKIDLIEGKLLEMNSTRLAGLPALQIEFTNMGLKTMEVWTIKDDRAYTVSYVAPEEDFETNLMVAKRMIQSFQFIE